MKFNSASLILVFVLLISSSTGDARPAEEILSSSFLQELRALVPDVRETAPRSDAPSYPQAKLRALRWIAGHTTIYTGVRNGERIEYAIILNASSDGNNRVDSFAEDGPAILLTRYGREKEPVKQTTLYRKDIYTLAERFHHNVFQFRSTQAYEFHSVPDAAGRVSVMQVQVQTFPGGRTTGMFFLHEGFHTSQQEQDEFFTPQKTMYLPETVVGWGDLSDPFTSPDGAVPDLGEARFEVHTRYVAAGAASPSCPQQIEEARRNGLPDNRRKITGG